ncbi:GNAT family N-acetyltransferase [Georgenia satyanarayanai]|uniref:GNAT family N-acetyltransferase n=1 Tax=Georgenia satyanarayanai TaxID=860221 RepID=UPI001265713C|nr:GNAT family N-acetyltransferase [Georgenia satyanarayanai]
MERPLFLRANADRWHEEAAWDADGATLLLVRVRRASGERLQLVGAGEPAPLAAAAAQAATDGVPPVGFGLLTRGTWHLVDLAAREHLALEAGPVWDWMWSRTVPPRQPGEERVGPVTGPDAAEEVRACLSRANPDTSADPADPDLTWWGYRDDAGVLRGVVAVNAPPGGPVHLSGLGTDTSWRRRGVGSAMMAGVTRWALGEHPLVHYGIWTDNDAARSIYTRLGYAVGHEVENVVGKPEA